MNPDSVPISEVVKRTRKMHPKAKELRATLGPIIKIAEQLGDVEDLGSLFALLEGTKLMDHMSNAVDVTSRLYEEVSPAKPRKAGPNTRCPCGSGKKYKRCCGSRSKRQRDKEEREIRAALEQGRKDMEEGKVGGTGPTGAT